MAARHLHAWPPAVPLENIALVKVCASHLRKWAQADLARLAVARGAGVRMERLAERFGVSRMTIIAKLAAARLLRNPAILVKLK